MKWFLPLILTLPLIAGELHIAVKKLDEKKIDQLLKNGTAIDALDTDGETAMHIAARIGRVSVAETLLKYEPDLYIENKKGYTPLAVAIQHNHVKLIKLLVKVQKKQKARPDLLRIHRSVMDDDIYAAERFILLGYDVDGTNKEGMTPLHFAAKKGSIEMVEFLLKHGADVLKVDDQGRDTLYFARYGGNEAVIQRVVEERKKSGKR